MSERKISEYLEIESTERPQTPPNRMRKNVIYGLIGLLVLVALLAVINLITTSEGGQVSDTEWVWVEDPLVKVAISDTSLVCNDGSPTYWYWRQGESTDKWVIYFEGTQTYCFDKVSCDARMDASPDQMSSNNWEDEIFVGGILSTNPEVNPEWYNANHVNIPSCSSDFYSGTAAANQTSSGYHFMGWDIVSTLLSDLIVDYDLVDASKITVAGNGGGGVGVLMFVDRIADSVQDGDAVVKGFADSAIMVDHEAYEPRDPEEECTEASKCDLNVALPLAVEEWQSGLPYRCSRYGYTWECMVAEHTAYLLESDTFWFQWLYESAQLTALNVPLGFPDVDDANLTAYLDEIADYYIDVITANEIETYMLPRCWAHEVVMSDEWTDIYVDGMNIPEAFAAFWDGEAAHLDDDCDFVHCNPTCPAATVRG